MIKLGRKTSVKAGLPPGTLVHIGEKIETPVTISLARYSDEILDIQDDVTLDSLTGTDFTSCVTWINVTGIHNVDIIERIGVIFDLHPLMLEDVVHSEQRPKLDDYDSFLFLVIKMISCGDSSGTVDYEQVSLAFNEHVLITFQERPGDVFDPVRRLLQQNTSRLRKMGADYLAYRLVDVIVDNYFTVLEEIGERINNIEATIMENPVDDITPRLQSLRSDILVLRKQSWPARELVNDMIRTESELIRDSTVVFLKDVHDHAVQCIDTMEVYRETIAGLNDLYLTNVSTKMNEVMKVLTIIATLFIPLSFLAGIYGMNFQYMPELAWRWGYPMFWVIACSTIIGMIVYFRTKKWF